MQRTGFRANKVSQSTAEPTRHWSGVTIRANTLHAVCCCPVGRDLNCDSSMLTDAFEKPKAGANLSDTIADALKDYPAASTSGRSRSIIPKCFRPSTSETSPSSSGLRRELADAQDQYRQLNYRHQHVETALSGSISDTLRLDRDKKLAEAQAAQTKQQLHKLQKALQESESRAADAGQQIQGEVQLLRNRLRGLTAQTHRLSSNLQTVQGGSIARLMETAWEGGATDTPTDQTSQLASVLLSLQELNQDVDKAQQQMSLLETTVQGKTTTDWQTQQALHEQLLHLQSQQWWGPQLAKGSVGLGCAYVGGIWWITKGVTKICMVPVAAPAFLVQRVFDMAKHHPQTLIYETMTQGPKDSQDTDTQITELSDAAQNPMLGKALNIEE